MKNFILNDSQLKTLHSLFLQSNGVCTDSRSIKPNQLFFALVGDRFDGNQFVAQALNAGALAVVVNSSSPDLPSDRVIEVMDTLKALTELAYYHRKQLHIPLLMITGTNGKTTTKELTAAVLKKKFNVLSTEGNLNNHIGVPLTLLRLTKEHNLAVIEAGASHEGEIAHLASVAAPNYGIITNIGKAHLEGFGSFEGVVRAKTELYHYLLAHGGTAFVHHSDTLLCQHIGHLHTIFYGEDPEDFISGKKILEKQSPYLSLTLSDTQSSTSVSTQLVGEYNLPNVLAAATVGRHFGVPLQDIASAIASYTPSNHRSQLIAQSKRHNQLIVDVYNANPSSMKIAINNFFTTPSDSPRLLIIGDMLELGDSSRDEHQKIIALVKQYTDQYIGSKAFFVGTELTSLKELFQRDAFSFFEDTAALIAFLESSPVENSFVLLKASHGLHFENLLAHL